jgi:hypothetical protein
MADHQPSSVCLFGKLKLPRHTRSTQLVMGERGRQPGIAAVNCRAGFDLFYPQSHVLGFQIFDNGLSKRRVVYLRRLLTTTDQNENYRQAGKYEDSLKQFDHVRHSNGRCDFAVHSTLHEQVEKPPKRLDPVPRAVRRH